jgi:asparagine synthase (glutamine-hydrolysing)
MWDLQRRAAIVFNGEIYNYRELRGDLETRGYRFASATDTEVLQNLYLEHGEEMLRHLNGIFAFAIWDARKRMLFVARDQFGVKPFYYAELAKGFLFASELKALLLEPSLPRDIDALAVKHTLTYLWSPAPRTMLKAVRKLPAGHAMTVRSGTVERLWRYYCLPTHAAEDAQSLPDAIRDVRTSLARSVERQMVSDVPVGAFLSGGLDSSSIVALARSHATPGPLECFTIGFRDKTPETEGMVEDLPYAQKVAAQFGLPLHVVRVGSEIVTELERMIYFLDEPQADPAPINVMFIAKLAQERGIKVLLSGAGGDDIFSGYRRHHALAREKLWSWLPGVVRQGMAGMAGQFSLQQATARRIAKALQFAWMDGAERTASYFKWIDDLSMNMLLGTDLRLAIGDDLLDDPLARALDELPSEVSPLNRMLYLEQRFFLGDHNLNYTDKLAMAAGVEVRVPFLDPELVELASRMPADFKQHGSQGKWILKQAMRGIVPDEVIDRPKTGFGAPLRHWLRGDLRDFVDESLSPERLRKRGLFDPAGVRRLLQADREGRIDGAYTIFALVCIETWCRLFIDAPVPVEPTGGLGQRVLHA